MLIRRTTRILVLLLSLAAACTPAAAEKALLERFDKVRSTDDLDRMAQRRFVRALVVYSKTFYFFDRGRERGLVAEGLAAFEKHLNTQLSRKKKHPYVHVVAVPVSRDQLIPLLLDGRGDLAAVDVIITPERQKLVDFSDPFYSDAAVVVVTAADVPAPVTLEDLSGQEIYVGRSSSRYENLVQMNRSFRAQRRKPAILRLTDERLEDEDLLEMVNAGLIPRVVVYDYNARFWGKVLPDIRVYPDIAVKRGAEAAWAFRKDSPQLKEMVNSFVAGHKIGTLLYNDAYRRYFKTTKWVKNATSARELDKFRATVELFKQYGERYDFDYLMVAAQGYQESGLDQKKRSPRGAVGVMQVLPSTGRLMKVGDVHKLEPNIHAGVKYLRELVDDHFDDPGIDSVNRTLFAFAAYNAGPTRIAQLRAEAARSGLDPNQWFNNVERVAAKRVGNEPVRYVANIYKYYIAYSMVEQRSREREQARGSPTR
jgi:membrane-bound lytic murein transglycosylase MltF